MTRNKFLFDKNFPEIDARTIFYIAEKVPEMDENTILSPNKQNKLMLILRILRVKVEDEDEDEDEDHEIDDDTILVGQEQAVEVEEQAREVVQLLEQDSGWFKEDTGSGIPVFFFLPYNSTVYMCPVKYDFEITEWRHHDWQIDR